MKFFHYERRSSKPQRGESNGKEEKWDASLVIFTCSSRCSSFISVQLAQLVSALKPKLFCEPRGKNTEQKIKNTKSDRNMKKTKT